MTGADPRGCTGRMALSHMAELCAMNMTGLREHIEDVHWTKRIRPTNSSRRSGLSGKMSQGHKKT